MIYTKEILEAAAKESSSVADVLRYLNLKLSGGTHAHISKRLKDFGIDTSHFTGCGHNKGRISPTRKKAEEILIVRSNGWRESTERLVRALKELGVEHICIECGQDATWNGKSLTLHVDHVDGNFLNCKKENLRFLCPNCHSQTPTYSRNRTPKSTKQNICSCGKILDPRSKTCNACRIRSTVDWPDMESLREMVTMSSYAKVGKELGVSATAVRRRVMET